MSETTSPSTPPTVRIAVVGVGGIGSTFAFQLARVAHHEVAVIARPGSKRLEQLRRDAGLVNTLGERADVLVADRLNEEIPYDLVLVTVQAQQVDAVLPALRRSAARRIQFMLNNFNPERLRDAAGAERCSFGMPFVQATVGPDGKFTAKIGAAGQKSRMDDQRSVSLFQAAGLPAVFEPEMLLWLRCHAPLGAAFESVCVAALRRGGGASWAESLVIARGMQESFTLVQRLGYRLYPAGKARLHASPAALVAAMLWAISRVPSFRNLLATAVNESRALVDAFIAASHEAKPPVSTATIEAMKPS